MSWSNDQLEIGMNVSEISKRIQYEFFFTRHRAGCNPDLFPFREEAGKRYIQRPAQLNYVVFQIAEDRHLFRICAECFDSFSIGLRLHADDRVILKHALKPSPHEFVSSERFVRDSSVDHRHTNAAFP